MPPDMGQLPRSKPTRFRRAIAGSVVVHLLLVSVASVAFYAGTETNSRQPSQPGFDTRADELALRLQPEEITITVPTPEAIKPREAVPVPPEQPVKPASAVKSAAPQTPAMHGALKAGQTIVYVLDCSGSMGEFGKLTLARAALVSTLRRQSAEVRFQVLAYNGAAHAVLPGICVVANAVNIAAAETGLTKLKATGRSNHVEAVRAAVALRPDVIVLLTDAEDLSVATFRSALAAYGKPLPVCVVRVTAEGVTPPRELK
ncbi:MAG: VWA domain-containing protein [Planctomycetes bacterium]|nr:VWA domain-containing protein [Planctomycetota bacterium]